jgi:hypothetical protein
VTILGPFTNSLSWVDSVTTGDNPGNWRQKLRDGVDATTSLTGERVSCRLTDGVATWDYKVLGKPGRVVLTGSHGLTPSLPGISPAEVDESKANAVALGRLNQSIRAATTSIEGGVFVGELGQTLRMIRNPARSLRTAVDEFRDLAKAIRRGRFRQRLRESELTQALADLWLEAQFGWRPFISDVDGGLEALREFAKKRDRGTLRVTGSCRDLPVASAVDPPEGYTVSVAQWRTHSRTIGTVSVIYRGAIRVEAKANGVLEPQQVGFDRLSWAPTLYELIPYSFLIDYFSNVGDVIRGWSNIGLRLAWCNRTVRKTAERTSWSEDLHPHVGNVTSVAFAPAKFVCSKVSVSRAIYSGTLVPDFAYEIPSLGSLKWLNIAALVANRRADRNWVYGN